MAYQKISTGGGSHLVGLTTDGYVYAWGMNNYYQCGSLSPNAITIPQPIRYLDGTLLSDIVDVQAGGENCMGLRSDGTVWTWGYGERGALGDGTWDSKPTATQVLGVSGVGYLDSITKISAGGGGQHCFALKNDGSLYVWGYGPTYVLGIGGLESINYPLQVLGVSGEGYLENVIDMGAGGEFSVAVVSGGDVYAWGSNWVGQVGNDTFDNVLYPTQVIGVSGVESIYAGAGWTVAKLISNRLMSWGSVTLVGDGTSEQKSVASYVVGPSGEGYLENVDKIFCGGWNTAAVLLDGSVWVWGLNNSWTLGQETSAPITALYPIPVTSNGLPTSISTNVAGSHGTLFVQDVSGEWYGMGAYGIGIGIGMTSDTTGTENFIRVSDYTDGGNIEITQYMYFDDTDYIDQTTEARSISGLDDFSLGGNVNEASVYGFDFIPNRLNISLSVPNSGAEIIWEYYNGTIWSSLSVVDGTIGLQFSGVVNISTIPIDWTKNALADGGGSPSGTYYWLRARIITTPPTTIIRGNYITTWAYNTKVLIQKDLSFSTIIDLTIVNFNSTQIINNIYNNGDGTYYLMYEDNLNVTLKVNSGTLIYSEPIVFTTNIYNDLTGTPINVRYALYVYTKVYPNSSLDRIEGNVISYDVNGIETTAPDKQAIFEKLQFGNDIYIYTENPVALRPTFAWGIGSGIVNIKHIGYKNIYDTNPGLRTSITTDIDNPIYIVMGEYDALIDPIITPGTYNVKGFEVEPNVKGVNYI